MLLGMDFLVANAFGAGRLADAHRALVDGGHARGRAGDGAHRAAAPRDPAVARDRHPAGRARGRHPLSACLDLEPVAAARLHGAPPLPAGARAGPSDHGHGGDRERGQRPRLLGAGVRSPRRACARTHRRRLGDDGVARLHAGVPVAYVVRRERRHPTGLGRVALAPDLARVSRRSSLSDSRPRCRSPPRSACSPW